MNGDDWISAEDAGRILRVSARMVYRYGEGEAPKLRTTKAGRRVLFNRDDVLAYAEEIAAENKPAPQTNIIRAEDLMRAIGSLQAELVRQAEELGELRGRIPKEEEIALRERMHELQRQNDRLQWELEQARAPAEKPTTPEQPRSRWPRWFGRHES